MLERKNEVVPVKWWKLFLPGRSLPKNIRMITRMLSLTESTPHLVPVITRPGSRVSPCASSSLCPALYTCVPMHRIFLLPMVTVVSMRTALFSMGLEAEDKHWIFPQMASLVGERRERCVIENDHVDTQVCEKETFTDEWIEKCSPFFTASVLPKQVFATVSVHVPCFIHLRETNCRGSAAICPQEIDNVKKKDPINRSASTHHNRYTVSCPTT